jgi:hypothetical protein
MLVHQISAVALVVIATFLQSCGAPEGAVNDCLECRHRNAPTSTFSNAPSEPMRFSKQSADLQQTDDQDLKTVRQGTSVDALTQVPKDLSPSELVRVQNENKRIIPSQDQL